MSIARKDHISQLRDKGNTMISTRLGIILSIVVIASFIYGVRLLTTSEKAEIQNKVSHKMKDTLPKKPEAKWKYIERLENYQSQAPSPTLNDEAKKLEKIQSLGAGYQTQDGEKQKIVKEWGIQCGPFRKLDEAQSVRATLALGGFKSKIYTREGLIQVRTILLSSRKDISNALNYMIDEDYLNCFSLRGQNILR